MVKWRDLHPPVRIALWVVVALISVTPTASYLLLVPDSTPPGQVIFNATLPRLGRSRTYSLHVHRNADFVRRLLAVDEKNGQVSIVQNLDCRGVWYPSMFTLHVESILQMDDFKNKRRRERHAVTGRVNIPGVQYYAMALRVLITGPDCEEDMDILDTRMSQKLAEARAWTSESYASFAMPSESDFTKICLKQSQFINSVSAFLPDTLLSEDCSVRYLSVDDPRFEVETSVGDLVSAYDQCILEPMWRIVIHLEITCFGIPGSGHTIEHLLKVVYHHERLNDTDIARRVRRELKNQSPYFEQALYVANVVEEKPSGVVVATLRARDPENSPVTYSMTSLLDSRSQGMFAVDEATGVVTTQTRLDRELVEVHYFRVSATDDSFPPRSGTTTLQINVLDANDHSPVFEKTSYETSIKEGAAVGTVLITVRATDKDVHRNAEIEYSFETPVEEFHIDGKSGVITTRKTLDRETTPQFELHVLAQDNAPQTERKSATSTVKVILIDDNDNYPQFLEKTYSVTVPEDVDISTNPLVASVRATDADEGQNAAIRYAIIGGNMKAQFTVDSLTGDVSLAKPLDYEDLRSFRLVIRAQDGGSPSRSNTTTLLVNVKDVNDNIPRFYSSLFQESVLESVPVDFSILQVQAYDLDEGSNSHLKYTLSSRDEAGTPISEIPLRIDPVSGWLLTSKPLDREVQNKYQFQVIAEDGGTPPRSASANVIITVQDVNDNDPQFHPKIYELVISETDNPGTLVTTVSATDPDENPRLHYEITNGNVRGRFSIASQNNLGLLSIAQPLDYRQEKRFVLTITATDSGGRTDMATVYVNISDANNYSPVFENAPYHAQVFEDAPVGTTVLVVQATDSDVGQNAQITYTLSTGMDQAGDSFTINPQTGALVTTKPLDRESVPSYLLTITARDGGVPSHSDTTDVEITVLDVNDNPPAFTTHSYQASVPEDALLGTSVLQVQATDVDMGANGRVRYSLSAPGAEVADGSFVVDASSGVIRTAKTLDRESVASYALTVYAVDRGSPELSATAAVSIRIEDVNDSPPAFESEKIVLYIPENSPIGSTVGELRAKDPDEGANAAVQYSIIGGEDSAIFSLVTRPSWDKAELLTMVDLDYESPRKKFELLVRAASPPLRSDVRVDILVTDVNDNAPVLKDFQVVFNNYRNCFPSGAVGFVPAFDADVSDQLHYRVLSGNNANLISLNETTGEITLSSKLNTNVPKLASMDISVTDGVNEVKATMTLSVRLISEDMLFNSITVRLADMTVQAFLSPLLGFFVDALAVIIPCPRDMIYVFDVTADTDVLPAKILNVSFSARRPDVPGEVYFTPQYLQERVYLNRPILARLSTVHVLPFDDNLCLREPCFNFETCLTVLKFGNASDFIASDSVLFRPIHPVSTYACVCPEGFTGSREQYLCDTEVDLCYSMPCHNGGSCMRKEGGYSCVCLSGFTGTNCEIDMNMDTCQPGICNKGLCAPLLKGGGFECHCHGSEVYTPKAPLGVTQLLPKRGGMRTPLSDTDHNELCQLRSRGFSKTSFLTFPALRHRHRLHVKLRFATQSENGLLLYNGRYNEEHDFIALEIIQSAVQLSFSLGSSVTRAVASIPGGVSDGQWHTVSLFFFNRTGTVSLDDCDIQLALKKGPELGPQWACANITEQVLEPRCALLTEPCHRHLDLTGPLQIGGLPNLPTDFQVANKDFEGCISDLHIDHKFVDLNSVVVDNGTHPGCHHKRNFCSSNPCKHGGKCKEGWGTYICECKDGHGGKDCSQGIKTSWRFRGDGVLSFNPLLRPIQLPWINSLSVRTLQKDAFLMSIQIGQNSSATMSLKDGLLRYTYNGEAVSLRQGIVSDGVWHHVEAKWMSNDVWLSLDHGQREVTQAFNAKVQGLYVGKILIGGPDASYVSVTSDFGYFDGCIQDVKVGSSQSSLQRPTVEENVSEGCGSQLSCSEAKCPLHSDCVDQWEHSTCSCHRGFVTPRCSDVCQYEPCDNGGRCSRAQDDWRGYSCSCPSEEFSGEYCERRVEQPCPNSWWGYPVCGPCNCNVGLGYDPDCNKSTGECNCKEHHYQIPGSDRCLPCDCYSVGSYHVKCDAVTGQCPCRPGVIGQRCDSCTNKYAEVTLNGCEVVYDGCPRDFDVGLWWERTKFEESAIASCPVGSSGKGSRLCSTELAHWDVPDLFNCTSDKFLDLRKLLSQLEDNTLHINSFVAVKVAADLQRAANLTERLYGADVLIIQQMVTRLLQHELSMAGLNLSHSQDKDFISNLVQAGSKILSVDYLKEWERIVELTGQGPVDLVIALEKFLGLLVSSQSDTYTNPFEIVSSNVVLGLDVVSTSSLFGFEGSKQDLLQRGTPKVIVPDTSEFLYPSIQMAMTGRRDEGSPVVMFPKYNNYLQDPRSWDSHTKVLVPISLLGIPGLNPGEIRVGNKAPDRSAVFSYALYRDAGSLYGDAYDETVTKRWGIQLKVGSHILSFAVLVPVTSSDHDEYEDDSDASVTYQRLSDIRLSSPIRLQMWLDGALQPARSNPQCVHWSSAKGVGEWSRSGCHTDLPDDSNPMESYIVNCTCYHLSTFAVLVDQIDLEFIPEPSFLEEIVTYIGFVLSIFLLFIALLLLSCIRGRPTNSNSIHKNIVFCILFGELVYFAALKLRRDLIVLEFACKMIAMFLHYFWLSAFSWNLVDSLHLHRMLTELRDVNHGQMRFYYTLGYGVPAVIVGLSVGVRADQYGNFYFCWLSLYESVVWSLVGPICLAVAVTLITLMASVNAAFTLKDHVLGYGNLRTLVWASVVSLPLLGIVWVLLMLHVSEPHAIIPPALSLSLVIHAAFTLAAYCFVNARVRRNLHASLLRCLGREVPKDLDLSVDGIGSSGQMPSDRPSSQTRSALAYRNTGVSMSVRRTLGIATSSTTSRSTAKTSSSPYRSDNHLRGGTNTDTSTSNYNSANEMRHYPIHAKHKEVGRSGGHSDSDSDNSVDGRSLELASSHSSDDDVSSRHHSTIKSAKVATSYLPNICEGTVPAPPTLNVLNQSDLFPNLSPLYAPRWSSQIPHAYHTNLGEVREEETSPQPLPHPYPTDFPGEDAKFDGPEYHVNLATVYEHDVSNYNTEGEDMDEKAHSDKYLFPYTAEEDHCPAVPGSRLPRHDSPSLRGPRDSPLYSAYPALVGKLRDSARSSPVYSQHRESPTYGVRVSPLLQVQSRGQLPPLLVPGSNLEMQANCSESEKDMSETPV